MPLYLGEKLISGGGTPGPRGESGVYVGAEKPTDPDIHVWINPEGQASNVSGGGITTDQINALYTLLLHSEYTKNVSSEIEFFRDAFGIKKTYTITCNLSNSSVDNSLTSVIEGMTYYATLTPDLKYSLDGANIFVSMGGVDITDSAYKNGIISIPSITGDIVIVVEAVLDLTNPVYALAKPMSFDGATTVDTGYRLFDKDKDFTILLSFSPANPSSAKGVVMYEWNSTLAGNTVNRFHVCGYSSWYWAVSMVKVNANCLTAGTETIVYAITHKANSNKFAVSYMKDGEKLVSEQTITSNGYKTFVDSYTETLKLGGSLDYLPDTNVFSGTINALEIYERVLGDDDINTFLGGGINGNL